MEASPPLVSDGSTPTVAVAIDTDKNSQYAVRWAVDNLLTQNSSLIFVHVRTQIHNARDNVAKESQSGGGGDNELQQFFLPFRGFCSRKQIQAKEVILYDIEVANAIVDFVHVSSISTLVIGASNHSVFTRAFRNIDVATTVCKALPEFCSVYVIAKTKVQSVRLATQSLIPSSTVLNSRISSQTPSPIGSNTLKYEDSNELTLTSPTVPKSTSWRSSPLMFISHLQQMNSPPSSNLRAHVEENNLSHHHHGSALSDASVLSGPHHHGSALSEFSVSGPRSYQSTEMPSPHFLSHSHTSTTSRTSSSGISTEIENEMRKLKFEMGQTMEMYSSACREAAAAKKKAKDIDRWKMEEERKLEAAKQSVDSAMAFAEMEKQKSKVAIEAVNMAQRVAELEVQKRKSAEMKAEHEARERQKAVDALARVDVMCRKYSIEEIESATNKFSNSLKIGEGVYGPVFRGVLDHTAVSIKVLRPDISQGRKYFQREVEVLSYLRHPNMVLLMGACPEFGCLVYEHMKNGNLEDVIMRRNNAPSLPWRSRFKICTEISTALLFLHQTKPEPIVHRNLKPTNILLDGNWVSKISDVGLSRLVPAAVAESVTMYHLTSATGAFCYIDPEYQQTGKLGVKSDIYSLGVILLQMITGKPPMGLAFNVNRAIEKGTFNEMLDETVTDWPLGDTLCFAKLALNCCELSRKDRPDLGSVILPELKRLSNLQTTTTTTDHNGVVLLSPPSSPLSQMQSNMSKAAKTKPFNDVHKSLKPLE